MMYHSSRIDCNINLIKASYKRSLIASINNNFGRLWDTIVVAVNEACLVRRSVRLILAPDTQELDQSQPHKATLDIMIYLHC